MTTSETTENQDSSLSINEDILTEMFKAIGIQEVDTIEDRTTGGFYDVPALPEEKEENARRLAKRAMKFFNKIEKDKYLMRYDPDAEFANNE